MIFLYDICRQRRHYEVIDHEKMPKDTKTDIDAFLASTELQKDCSRTNDDDQIQIH